jgi:RNA-binding protein
MLTSKQRGYLSKLAATLDPTVMVGKEGASEAVERAIKAEFMHRELLKLRFVASKEERDELARKLAEKTGAELVRVIGNVAIYYRRADNSERRNIELPS